MASSSTLKIILCIESRLQNVALAGLAIHRLCEYASFTEGDAALIELAVVEALNNAILHAYDNQAGHQVSITWTFDSGRLCIDIADQGQVMTVLPSGEMPEPARENGRGWPIIQACMDRVEYRSEGNVNTLTLIKELKS